ncbi:ran-binding protein 3 isoform X3 [Photinus pyralis]|uniref:ran-binding protein 3 isoform X3 n=1 Tax=Photinus pyralis TaxID=7054 RepID=UPI00126702CA|nr:ran-binding protein 3 isoform X3 [Photinus pyralis]
MLFFHITLYARRAVRYNRFIYFVNESKMADSCRAVTGDEFTKTRDLKGEESKSILPGEDNENSAHSLDTIKMCSPSSFATSFMPKQSESNKSSCSTNQFILKSSSLLRPSQLNGSIASSTSSPKHSFLLNPKKESESQTTHTFLPLIQNGNKSEGLKVTSTAASSTSSITQSSNFVFGQNIQDRVVSDKQADDLKSDYAANSNGTSDMLFTSVLKENSKSDAGIMSQGTKTLSESAREYEESRAVKRKFEEVEVITGEEGEKNIIQITCKLFAFDKSAGSWQERGRGILRLNDQETADGSQSRLVFRVTGSLRVVLNTKIWAEMTIELASNKSIRFMAFDTSGEIKVFLLTGSPDDIKQLYKLLEVRLQKEISRQKCSKTKTSEPSCSSQDDPLKKSDDLPPGY